MLPQVFPKPDELREKYGRRPNKRLLSKISYTALHSIVQRGISDIELE